MPDRLDEAIQEAERFLTRAREAQRAAAPAKAWWATHTSHFVKGTKSCSCGDSPASAPGRVNGAAKRASLDLSMALARYRKG